MTESYGTHTGALFPIQRATRLLGRGSLGRLWREMRYRRVKLTGSKHRLAGHIWCVSDCRYSLPGCRDELCHEGCEAMAFQKCVSGRSATLSLIASAQARGDLSRMHATRWQRCAWILRAAQYRCDIDAEGCLVMPEPCLASQSIRYRGDA